MSHTANASIIIDNPLFGGLKFGTWPEPLVCWINSQRWELVFEREQITWHGYCVCAGHMWLVDDICSVGTWCMSGTFRVNSRSAVRGFASRLVQYVGKEALLTGSDWICLERRILGTMTMIVLSWKLCLKPWDFEAQLTVDPRGQILKRPAYT